MFYDEVSQVPDYSAQEIFDIVAKHLMEMKGRAGENSVLTGEFVCRYRTPEGKKCAFGVLIPDELYSRSFEGRNAQGLFEGFPDIFIPWIPHRFLLRSLQLAHDNVGSWTYDNAPLLRALLGIAADFKLDTEVLSPYKDKINA